MHWTCCFFQRRRLKLSLLLHFSNARTTSETQANLLYPHDTTSNFFLFFLFNLEFYFSQGVLKLDLKRNYLLSPHDSAGEVPVLVRYVVANVRHLQAAKASRIGEVKVRYTTRLRCRSDENSISPSSTVRLSSPKHVSSGLVTSTTTHVSTLIQGFPFEK